MSNQEQKRKPVWRINTGRGIPTDFGIPSKILVRKQYGISVVKTTYTEAKTWAWDRFYLASPEISAYQTTRTRAAKYERVECGFCEDGFIGKKSGEIAVCSCCNGKSYTLERIK